MLGCQLGDIVSSISKIRVEDRDLKCIDELSKVLEKRNDGESSIIQFDSEPDLRSLISTYLSLNGWHYLDREAYQHDEKSKWYYVFIGTKTLDFFRCEPLAAPLDFSKLSVTECESLFEKDVISKPLNKFRKCHNFKVYTGDDYEYLGGGWYRFPVKCK